MLVLIMFETITNILTSYQPSASDVHYVAYAVAAIFFVTVVRRVTSN